MRALFVIGLIRQITETSGGNIAEKEQSMNIFQGEQVSFGGYLKNNSGQIITNLSGYDIAAMLSRKGSSAYCWSTRQGAGDGVINVNNTTGYITFVLGKAITSNLMGAYTFECKITSRSSGDIAIGIAPQDLKVAISTIGQRGDL